jgi:hypothetical protein
MIERPMINELDVVALTHDITEAGLRRGDFGAVVHRYLDGSSYEVEFFTPEGQTIALLTLTDQDIRLVSSEELSHRESSC